MSIQQMQEAVPGWANWLVITGSALLSWIQPIAGAVAIVWGGLQIYTWCENRWRKKKK